MIFDTERCRQTYYSWTPNDECGNVAGLGWAGLYMSRGNTDGAMVLEYNPLTAKMVSCIVEESAVESYWGSLCEALELSGDPEHDDVVIEEERVDLFVVSPGSTRFNNRWLALFAVCEEYGDDHPPIWFLNRRGVFVLMPEDEVEGVLRNL